MLAVAGIVIAPDISSDYESHDGLDRRADAARGREPAAARRTHCRALAGTGIAWELLFVDDDSGDGSSRVAAALAERLPVRMAVRRGARPDLSRAVLEGIAHSRFDRIVVMDADLSHPPERIPDPLAALEGPCDMVVGSRYVAGASTAGDWGLTRVLNSRLATLLAAPLVRCSDPMAGFFAVDRSALPDLASLRPVGYKIGLELMVRGRLRVGEAPIAFDDRRRGRSKLGWRQRFDYLRHLGRLYVHVLAGRCAGRDHADDGQGQAEKAPARRRRAVRCAPRFTRNGCRRGHGGRRRFPLAARMSPPWLRRFSAPSRSMSPPCRARWFWRTTACS